MSSAQEGATGRGSAANVRPAAAAGPAGPPDRLRAAARTVALLFDQRSTFDRGLTGLLAVLAVLLLFFSRRLPVALLLFAAGLGLALWSHPGVFSTLGFGFTLPMWSPPPWHDFVVTFPKAALPQIPLTTLNSVKG